MKKWTNLLLVALLLIMSMALIQPVFASEKAAVDVNGHWAEKQISAWMDQGLIKGYADGSFKPNDSVTRAEFVTMVNNAFGYIEESQVAFTDVKISDWFFSELAKASAAGYIKGNQDRSMRPNSPISRQEAAVIISRILKTDSNVVLSNKIFGDAGSIPDWSRSSISAAANSGYMSGYPDNTFRPQNNISRAEAVAALAKVAGTIYSKAGVYGTQNGVQTITGNVTAAVTGVTLKNTIIEGNLYLTEGIGDGEVILENVTVTGTTVISGGGMNSIVIINTMLGAVTIDVPDGAKVRLVASGSSKIGEVSCNSNAKLEENELDGDGFLTIRIPSSAEVNLAGSFSEAIVTGQSAKITVNGTIGTLNVQGGATGTEITVSKGSTINAVTLNAPTTVTGEGRVVTANLNVSGSTIEQQPETLNVGNDVTGNVDGNDVGDQETHKTGGGGGSNGDEPETIIQDGTSTNPYLIYTAADLNAVHGGVAGYTGWDLSKAYKQMTDIDLSAYATGEGWEPIGNWGSSFTGSFNGNGYAIKNLYINRPDDDPVGFFGAAAGATLEKLTLINADISGDSYVGGIAGYAEDETVINACSFNGDIKAYNFDAGGVTGYLDDSTIRNCYAVGNVISVGGWVGGIAGENYGTIEYSYSSCHVSGSEYTGGMVGYTEGTIAESSHILGGAVTSIDGGYTFSDIKSFGRIAGENYMGSCSGSSVSALLFYPDPIDALGQDFSDMTGANGETTDDISFTGWDATIWNTDNDMYPVFTWQTAEAPAAPFIRGLANGGTFYGVAPSWTTEPGVTYEASLSHDGGAAADFVSGSDISDAGDYLLTVTATKDSTSLKSSASMAFTIDPTPIVAPTLTGGVTDGAIYNAILPTVGYNSSPYNCSAELSTDGGTTFVPFSLDLYADPSTTEYIYRVMARSLTYPDDYNQVSYTINGAGTETKPFLVKSCQDLAIADNNAANFKWGTGKYYVLDNDLDFSEYGNFNPLGGGSSIYAVFEGSFDGQGHTISNMTIYTSATDVSEIGVFSANKGTISNLNISNIVVSSGSTGGSMGGLAGTNMGTLSQCNVSGSISSSGHQTGGLVGYNTATVSDCETDIIVTCTGWQGAGGLAGSNKGTISRSYTTGSVDSYAMAGGLVGGNVGVVENCYSTADVTGTGSNDVNSAAFGGLVGRNAYNLWHAPAATMSNSYATGTVTGWRSVGGLVGEIDTQDFENPVCTVANSVSLGSASAGDGSSNGPVFGSNYGGTVTGCSAITAEDAKSQATFTGIGWDLDTIWTIDEGVSYPTLRP